ncbi:MAG: hypothetical protein A2402_01915 [Candidatus Staskawiczbacteria bacterium RIFOXYC1_FULL_37_43]|uniref:DUF4830 domain-containing protein n=1 Tax=Candidatus Nomurabacteria bacterium RIFOXYA1_FULL_35_17 TaxID=1801798 RepID=A0A1F6YHM9_9BACT|nr:MAG: hypothetical protein A2192_01400 [Candidatus Nomurabacteria bacterium RIFOXYA1_FULL_35_17]OGZ63524.1 MAG: hypothetical protein A2813_00270 [Candidatus Staskawiczbacteria bacterium RIFCSPHIGHO2_01_FULL_37_17]OGZ71384.1 MAG: hypothetical protein A2891_02255 [Candidatus Staskawiczbacteria bacterium RIFCSPLOWO2_01_FULL_37_19]OGZ77729.1 MAG: hypothetical protein A2280_00800 [Candidatus Staskawiczbacteria bacterium RIFOXYA12_FULL_37_10]OGZ80777.1 MAG: hypothetical protein A2353_00865 [Candida
MNDKFILMLAVILIILAGGLFYFLYRRQSPQVNIQNNITDSKIESQNEISLELKKLNITAIEKTKEMEYNIPENLSDVGWYLKKIICEEGGYDLSPYAGKTVLLTRYSTNEVYDNTEPLDVWAVSSKGKVVCVYKTVTENSTMAPGVFSVKENPLIKKK